MPYAFALLFAFWAVAAGETKTIGKAITLRRPMALADAMAAHAGTPDEEILVEGKATKVCQNKGCWMVLNDGKSEIRITFKDYAFFVPKESAGRQLRAQGLLKLEVLSVKTARHYLKDEGASKEEIAKVKVPVKTWTFVASGVEFL